MNPFPDIPLLSLAMSRLLSGFLFLALMVSLAQAESPASSADAKHTKTQARALVEQWLGHHREKPALALDFVQERQLKTLRRPLSRNGQLWMSPDGRFRWQIDDTASQILIREQADSPLIWIDSKKAVYRILDADADPADGQTASLRFLLHSQATDWTAFDRVFDLQQAIPLPDQPGVWRLRLDLRDRRASLAVKDVLFDIEPATGALHSFEFHLRDGSLLRTRITRVQKDPSLPAELFIAPLAGLKPQAS